MARPFPSAATAARTMRLFYALWPLTDTQRHWFDQTTPVMTLIGGRRMPASNLHMTLHFLGDVPGDKVGLLSAIGSDTVSEALPLRLDRIECWQKSGIACLRATETPALQRLVGRLETALSMERFALEKRRFKAHVTLARDIASVDQAMPVWPVLEWQATTLALVRSRLTPAGSEYAVIDEWPLFSQGRTLPH